ncbi:TPA: EpsG family protein [Escherichia coli]
MLILSSCERGRLKIFFLFSVLAAVFFSGVRYDAGNDYFTYYGMVKGEYWFDNIEISPRLILSLAKSYQSPMIFFLITSAIYISSVAYFCWKQSKKPEISFFLFLLLPLSLLTSFGYVRQYVAIGLFLVSLSAFIDKKYFISFLFIIFSVSFHTSAIVFAFAFVFHRLLSYRVYPIWLYVLIMTFSYPLSLLIVNYAYLAGNYQEYITGTNVIDSGKKIGLICVSLFFYFWLFRRKLSSSVDVYFFNLYYVFSLIYLVLMDFGEYVSRISYYLMPCAYILFVSTLSSQRNTRLFQLSSVIIFGLVMFYATLYFASINPSRDFLTNYSVILFNAPPK